MAIGVDKVLAAAEKLVSKNRRMDINDIMLLIPIIMEIVETYKNATGEEKKNAVIEVCNVLIDKYFTDGDKSDAKDYLNTFGPILIDTTIKASKGLMELNKKKSMMCCCK